MREAVAAAAAEAGGVAIACDVGSEADVERLVAVARARLGRIDAIVSNAGLGGFGPLADDHAREPGTGCSPPT